MTLKTLFSILISVILLVTLSLAGMIVSQEWSGHIRGNTAIAATNRATILNELEGQLAVERVASWDSFEADYPLPEPVAHRLAETRAETDRLLGALIENSRASATRDSGDVEPFLPAIQVSLVAAREQVDTLLRRPPSKRTYNSFLNLMPRMLGPAALLGPQLAGAAADVIKADPELAGIIAVARIGLALRDTLGEIAAVTLPRLDAGEQLTEADIAKVRSLLTEVDRTTKLLELTFYLVNPTNEMRTLLANAKEVREGMVQRQLDLMVEASTQGARDGLPRNWSSRPFAIWAARINEVRNAIIQETANRVRIEQASRTERLRLVLMAVGAIGIIILAALFILQRRVVNPLAHLGFAITRIADGDRSQKLTIRSSTREIATMVLAVETLRQAALVADAAVLRQREAAERRARALQEILGILQSVRDPTHALETDVARLADAMGAIISMIVDAWPPALDTAVAAIRDGLPAMHEAVRELDTIIDAACETEPDGLDEKDIAASTLKVREHIVQLDVLARRFIQPCLLALRDAWPRASDPPRERLRELIDDQFDLIESAVATMASMRATVTRAEFIVRELPVDAPPLAA
jgi:methyl-accepting chemotaxis protein